MCSCEFVFETDIKACCAVVGKMYKWTHVSEINSSRDIHSKWHYFILHSACLKILTTSHGCFLEYRLHPLKIGIITNWVREILALWRQSVYLLFFFLRLERNQFGGCIKAVRQMKKEFYLWIGNPSWTMSAFALLWGWGLHHWPQWEFHIITWGGNLGENDRKYGPSLLLFVQEI